MTQERATSIRILQSNKKKTLSPVIYLLIGFLSGIIFAALIFFLFTTDSSPSDTVAPQQEQALEDNNRVQTHSKVTAQVSEETAAGHHETAESVEDNNFTQPGSNDLNKFFQRTAPPAAPAPAGQHISPFANEPNAKAQQKVVPAKSQQGKSEPAPAITNKTVKPAVAPQPAKAAPTKEPEAEAPEATVQIKVTQKPFAVNELQ